LEDKPQTAAKSGDTINLAAMSGIITTTSPLSVTTGVMISGPLTKTLLTTDPGVVSNTASYYGGGIENLGSATIPNSTERSNHIMNSALLRFLLPAFVRRHRGLFLYVLAVLLPLGALPVASPERPALAAACILNDIPYDPCPDFSPPGLLSLLQLQAAPTGPQGLYTATAAQIASLQTLESQAIANTIADHNLASTDTDAVMSWGRNVALSELWALLVQAIQTPQASRTTDQQNAVDWLSKVAQREGVAAAQDAGLEYVKWAGLGQAAYKNLLATNPSQANLQTFLSSPPVNYNNGGSFNNYQVSTGGYCVYQSPSPYGSDYTANIFNGSLTSTVDPDCYAPCPSLLGCDPPTPSYDQFTKWGAATADDALFNTTGFANVAHAAAVAAGISGVAVAAGTGVGISSALASVMNGTAFQQAVFPFAARVNETTSEQAIADAEAAAEAAGEDAAAAAEEAEAEVAAEAAEIGGETAAAGAGAVVGALIFAIVVGVIEGIQVVDAANLPGKIASLIAGAPTAAQDLNAMLGDSTKAGGLFGLFIGAGLPQPRGTTCTNSGTVIGGTVPCLNATAIPASSPIDLEFSIQAKGATTTTSSTLSWKDTGGPSPISTTARLSETWFIDAVSSTGLPATTVQTLQIRYTDWSGKEQLAWLVQASDGSYEFVGAPESSLGGAALDTTTCIANNNCFKGTSINIVGTDGNDDTVTVIPGPKPTLKPQVNDVNPLEGNPVRLSANGASPVNSHLTYQWRFEMPSNTIIIGCGSPPCLNWSAPVSDTDGQESYTWTTSGSFHVEVTATDEQGRSTMDIFVVTVGDVPPTLAPAPLCPSTPSCNVYSAALGSATALHAIITHIGSDDAELATVNWGDGAVDVDQYGGSVVQVIGNPVTLTPSSGTALALSATHTYANPGSYTVTITVTDQGGGTASVTTTERAQHITTVTWPAPRPITYGTALGASQLDASAGSTGGANVPGTFAYSVDGQPVTANEVLAAGTHTLSVQFTPSDTTLYTTPATVTLSLSVNQAPLSITASSPSVVYNGTVPAITPSYTGFVNNESAALLTTQPTCGSTAPSSGPVGTYTTNCTGAADGNYSINYTSGTLTISKATTNLTLSASPSPSTQGQSATFTALVAVTAPGAGTPSGTVTFKDGTTTLGTGQLSVVGGNDQATFSTSGLAVGPHTITASYSGDTSFLGGTSAALTQYVNTNLSGYPKPAGGAYNLSNANLSGGYFVNAQLAGASLIGSNLKNAVFTGADLTGANLSNSNFMGSANFTHATLTNANLSSSNFKGADFSGATLSGANLTNSNLIGAAGLRTATLTNVVWSNTACPDGSNSRADGGTCVGHL
jgi:hypothetical protein